MAKPPKSIFSLSADGLWFASVFCTHMMFCRALKELQIVCPIKMGNIEMSMSVWHREVLIPITKFIAESHKMPSFAEKALSELESLGSFNGAITLHVCLLFHAGKEILQECRGNNVGPKTLEEVSKWFDLLSEIANSSLFAAAPPSLKAKFIKLLQEDLPSEKDAFGKQEHPYFFHDILFLRIAHMIFFYCRNNLLSGFANSKEAHIQVNRNDMEMWETLSCQIFQDTFNLNSGYDRIDGFAFINLGNEEVTHLIQDEIYPSPAHVHIDMLNYIREVVQTEFINSLQSDWNTDAPKLLHLLSVTEMRFEKNFKKVFHNRTKQRTWYMKNRKSKQKYKNKQRYAFQRDRFIMGCQSWYWKNRTAAGRAAGKFQFTYPDPEVQGDESDNSDEI